MYQRTRDEENGFPAEHQVSLGACYKKQLPRGMSLAFWHGGISDEVILLGPFPESTFCGTENSFFYS